MIDLAIIGGGVAGLAAAYEAAQGNANIAVFEKDQRFGGLIGSIRENSLVMETGPDGFITRKQGAWELAHDLGLADEIIGVNDTLERIYVLAGKRMVPLPDGLRLLVPTNPVAFLASPLFSWPGKLRALAEPLIPARTDDDDESLADFVTRRFGAEAVDKLAEPLLAGVYNADMQRQSIQATFPQYRALEKEYGSVIRGMQERRSLDPPKDRTPLFSFRDGCGRLPEALAAHLTTCETVTLRLSTEVTALEREEDHYMLLLADGERVKARSVILATPAMVSGHLVRYVAPEASRELHKFRYEGIGSAYFSYPVSAVPRKLDAYGIVIPGSAKRPIDGMQWATSKWAHRAPAGIVLLRIFFGGPLTRPMLYLDDDFLRNALRDEIQALLGITATPMQVHVKRWENAYPQYDVGHRERVERIRRALPPGLAVVGNAYYGVGVPDTVAKAREVARNLLSSLTEILHSAG